MSKLATANQITIWLENQIGFDKYSKLHPNNPGYFLHFASTDPNDTPFADLDEALDYLAAKIRGENPAKEYGFALTKKVKGGLAGAAYLYPEPALQTEADISELNSIIVELAQGWADAHLATMDTPQYNVGKDKYLVITIQLD